MPIQDNDWESLAPTVTLRPYQIDCLNAIREGWKSFSRTIAVLATGAGKTVIFSHVAKEEVENGGRVLIIAHTDELLEQAIDKLRKTTGTEAEKEKADERASPYAKVVVASIQSMARTNRLISFSDDHFSLVIVDESHRSLAKSYLKTMAYFHLGAHSLSEDFKMPKVDEPFEFKARVLGVTATSDRGDKRNLGEFFQSCVFDYGLLQACRDGWLVRPIIRNLPLKIDLRGVKKTGGDYDAGQLVERITPFLKQIAKELAGAAHDRKLVAFTPSIETAELLSIALKDNGIDADFVSGSCTDRDEKIAAFDLKPNGSAITCAMLLLEGWDCASANAICVLRPTKIRALYVQAVGRGSRTLPGILDGLNTPAERLLAISQSAKPDNLVIDFLYACDRMDLVQAADIVATTPELRQAVIDTRMVDLVAAEEKASRDLLLALQKAAKKHANRQARTINPLAWAMSLGDPLLASYQPENDRDALPPTPGQIDFMRRQHIDTDKIKYRGLATKLIGRILTRIRMGLATPGQLDFLHNLGVSDEQAALLTHSEASATIALLKSHPRSKIPVTASDWD